MCRAGRPVEARRWSWRERGRRAYAARVPPEHRREQLLDAALDLVVTRGHDAATVDAVAARAGVTDTGALRGVLGARRPARRTARPRDRTPSPSSPTCWCSTPARSCPARSCPGCSPGSWGRSAPRRSAGTASSCRCPGMPAEFHAARDEARARLEQVAGLVDAARQRGSARRHRRRAHRPRGRLRRRVRGAAHAHRSRLTRPRASSRGSGGCSRCSAGRADRPLQTLPSQSWRRTSR